MSSGHYPPLVGRCSISRSTTSREVCFVTMDAIYAETLAGVEIMITLDSRSDLYHATRLRLVPGMLHQRGGSECPSNSTSNYG